jgi:glutamate N-acetyltransferase/amino-acid N-acetyltransferase
VEHANRATEAIMTSDTKPKQVAVQLKLGGKTVRIGGTCKGAGMIQPGMSPTGARPAALPSGVPAGLHATMLGFITTDAAVEARTLQKALTEAVANSFNRITVDGDMSTNDTVLLLASGVSGISVGVSAPAALRALFQEALDKVCFALAEKIVGDGEKITKVVAVEIEGARTRADAEKIARAIGNSLLVKSSWYGEDPNWGRLADAAGYARTGLDEAKLDIYYDDVPAVLGGKPLPENKPKWKEVVKAARFAVRLKLNLGDAKFRLLAADLTDGYVNYNKSE